MTGFGWELMITAGGQAGHRSVDGKKLFFASFISLGFHSDISFLVMA